jgi:hypothetical protein
MKKKKRKFRNIYKIPAMLRKAGILGDRRKKRKGEEKRKEIASQLVDS